MFYQMMHIVHLKRYPFAFTHGTGTGRYQLTGSLPVRYWYHQGETEPRCYRTGILYSWAVQKWVWTGDVLVNAPEGF
eukprot:COSAG02_NODE_21711_length_777_cov_2.985251_2_plen_77_part_00